MFIKYELTVFKLGHVKLEAAVFHPYEKLIKRSVVITVCTTKKTFFL